MLRARRDRLSSTDRSPRSRTRRCWWRSKPTWRHRPGRARATARSGLGFGSVATSGLPASGCSASMRDANERRSGVSMRVGRSGGITHGGEIITRRRTGGTDGPIPSTPWTSTTIALCLAAFHGRTVSAPPRPVKMLTLLALRMASHSQYLSTSPTGWQVLHGVHAVDMLFAGAGAIGVADRGYRTLKEQIIHGRIYRNIAELRDAVRDFVELYNAQWIVEKNGYLSPAQARQAWPPRSQSGPPFATRPSPWNRLRYTRQITPKLKTAIWPLQGPRVR